MTEDFMLFSPVAESKDDVGKRSLGFLNNSLLDNSLNTCAINILPMDENSFDGRESLGILDLNSIFNRNDKKIPNILLTLNESINESVCDILDTAFLNTASQKFPSTSSYESANISFHSASLEGPSKIYTLSSNCDTYRKNSSYYSPYSILSDLNVAFLSPSKHKCRRIQSLPEEHTNNFEADHECKMITKNIHYATFNGNINDPDKSEDDQFHDAVFIEGKYIAHKIADGSILNDSFNNEMGNLDNIPPPSWNEFPEPEESIDTDVPVQKNFDISLHDNNDFENDSKIATSITDINSDSNNLNSNRSVLNKSLDAKEILQNLSEILNTTGRSDQLISEGQHLLNSLAELLCDKSVVKSTNFEDSGHSSSVNELNFELSHNSYNKTDLIGSSLRRQDNSNKRLSLSLNCDALSTKSTIPKIYKKSNISNLDLRKNKDINKNLSTKSEGASNSSLGQVHTSIKLKNKSTDKLSKKGPLKAVIPIKDMKKKEIKLGTPERKNSSIKESLQYKKTSTPINKPKLIPVAASTPTPKQTENLSSSAKCPQILRDPSSPQNKSPTVVKSRRSVPSSNSFNNHSTEDKRLNQSLTSVSSKEKNRNVTPLLRKSITQPNNKVIKRTGPESKLTMYEGRTRSNSLGSIHSTGLMSSMTKIRENLVNSPDYKKITKPVLKESNKVMSKLYLGDNKQHDPSKSNSLLPKLKKLDKENFTK